MTCVNQGQGEMDFSSVALTMQKLNGIEPHFRESQPR
jgi:hypothetical protein